MGNNANKNKEPKKIASVEAQKVAIIGAIIVAVLGLVGVGINAYATYLSGITEVQIPIYATQTAEAKLTALASELTLVPINTLTPTALPAMSILRLDSDYEIHNIGTTTQKLERKYESLEDLYSDLTNTPLMDGYLLTAGVWASFELGITSLSSFEWLQVEPVIYVRIENIEKYTGVAPDTITACRGGEAYRDFFVTLPADEDLEAGAIFPSERNTTFDYYSLEPGERAVYIIEITPMKPGVYDFSLGVKFWYNGEVQEVWTPNSYHMIVYDKFRNFVDINSYNCGYFTGIIGYDCYYEPTKDYQYNCDETMRYEP